VLSNCYYSDCSESKKRSRRNDLTYSLQYHQNAIKNRRLLATRSPKKRRLTHPTETIVTQTSDHEISGVPEEVIDPSLNPIPNSHPAAVITPDNYHEHHKMAVDLPSAESLPAHITATTPVHCTDSEALVEMSSHISTMKRSPRKTKGSGSQLFESLHNLTLESISRLNNISYSTDTEFQGGFQEFLVAVTDNNPNSLTDVQRKTKLILFKRMNKILETFLIDVENSEFTRLQSKDILNCLFSTYFRWLLFTDCSDATQVSSAAANSMSDFIRNSCRGDNNLVHFMSSRMVGLTNFEEQFAKRIKFQSWGLMFLYEMMREKVVIAYPIETGDGDTPQTIRKKHNDTLRQLVSHWKPASKDVTSLCTSMKVISPVFMLTARLD
jgi:hypothetical protein